MQRASTVVGGEGMRDAARREGEGRVRTVKYRHAMYVVSRRQQGRGRSIQIGEWRDGIFLVVEEAGVVFGRHGSRSRRQFRLR